MRKLNHTQNAANALLFTNKQIVSCVSIIQHAMDNREGEFLFYNILHKQRHTHIYNSHTHAWNMAACRERKCIPYAECQMRRHLFWFDSLTLRRCTFTLIWSCSLLTALNSELIVFSTKNTLNGENSFSEEIHRTVTAIFDRCSIESTSRTNYFWNKWMFVCLFVYCNSCSIVSL